MDTIASIHDDRRESFPPGRQLALTVAACLGTAALALPWFGVLDLVNIVMLFLLTVLLIAVKLGRNAAVLASILSALLFDLFFVPPRFSLAIANFQYLITFLAMLATALTTAHLAAGLRQQARQAERRERRTRALYQTARELAGTLTVEQVDAIARTFVEQQLAARAVLLLPAVAPAALTPLGAGPDIDGELARRALTGDRPVLGDAAAGPARAAIYLPLRAPMRTRGVLAVACVGRDGPTAETLSLLETLASLIAVGLERLHYVEVARNVEIDINAERLRNSILAALSHDLRTPLTAMVGLADSLFLIEPALPPPALETAQALREQAAGLAGMVGNLLEMARLNAGAVKLRREWQPLEEVVGASIKLLGEALAGHPVRVELAPDLPLLEFDAVLIERVLSNLLENAAKYAPAGSVLDLTGNRVGEFVEVAVMDRGPGFPDRRRDELFAPFVRGRPESSRPGTGLGLAICKAIIAAHGGVIGADDRPGGGARVRFTLPVGQAPAIEEEPA